MSEERRISARVVATLGATTVDLDGAVVELGRAGDVRWMRVAEGVFQLGLRLDEEDAVHGSATLDGRGGPLGRAIEVENGGFAPQGIEGTLLRLRVLGAPTPGGLRVAEALLVVIEGTEASGWLAPREDPPAEIDEQAFTEIVAETPRAAGVDAEVHGSLEIAVRGVGDLTLHNAWRERPAGERALARHIRRVAKIASSDPSGGTIGDIVPLVRSAMDLAGTGLVARAVAADIGVVYALDRPDTLQMIPATALPMPVEELHGIAVRNLRARVPTVEVYGTVPGGPLMLVCGGTFESSMIADPAVGQDLATLIGETPVVVVAARDLVLVARAGDAAARARHVQIARETTSRAISSAELVWSGEGWTEAPRPDREAELLELPLQWRVWPLPSVLTLFACGFALPWGPAVPLRPYLPWSVHAPTLVGAAILLAAYSQWQGLMDEHPRRDQRKRARRREWAMWGYAGFCAIAGALALGGTAARPWALVVTGVAVVSELFVAREDRRRVEA